MIRRKKIVYLLAFGMVFGLLISGCKDKISSHSELFQQIFADDSSTFRKSNIGDIMSHVRENELPNLPEHDDKLGMSYNLRIDSSATILVDYYSDNIRNERSLERVASIVANISLDDEVRTAQLYSEIQEYLNQHYGIYSGTYGDYSWEAGTRYTPEMEVRLLLAENKRGITLNFVNTQPEYLADSLAYPAVLDTVYDRKNQE
ncbi:MAG: hypothetical protein SF052_26850 [Bacteroidia bacterium]|nr:hypothetical protein [Bacteroidia bacterium]